MINIPLKLIFQQLLKYGKFPKIWKVANIVPVHKKEDKSLVKNYCPVTLIPVFIKFSKEQFIINYSTTSCIINFLRLPNQLFIQETHALPNFYP